MTLITFANRQKVQPVGITGARRIKAAWLETAGWVLSQAAVPLPRLNHAIGMPVERTHLANHAGTELKAIEARAAKMPKFRIDAIIRGKDGNLKVLAAHDFEAESNADVE